MIIKLATVFNGRPAPGGEFNTETATYTKLCRARSGGQHPHRYDLGALDDPIVQRLRALGCKLVVLELPGGTYKIPFQAFMENGYPQKWNDPRFVHARWYCPARYWNLKNPVGLEPPCKEERTAPEQEQASLFESAELQSLAQAGRWNQ